MSDIYTKAEIAAERRQARIGAIEDAIAEFQVGVDYAVDSGLDELVRLGVFTSFWGSGVERNRLCRRIAEAAVREMLNDPACSLPLEVRHLFREYLEGAQ